MEEIVEKIIRNAQNTNEVVQKLSGKLKNQALLWEYFHLRPTSSGVTIVSHHPCAPMRGADCTADELERKLLDLDLHLSVLSAEYPDEDKLYSTLENVGFERRTKQSEEKLEEDVQAAFISGMISGGAEYEGIQFLASELILRDTDSTQQHRFDVVGYTNGTLYIFELKRGRTTEIYKQMDRYRSHFEAHKQEFEKLLAAYPRTVCTQDIKINNVKYIAVMKDARLSKVDWQEKTSGACVDTWLFRPALAFRKLQA